MESVRLKRGLEAGPLEVLQGFSEYISHEATLRPVITKSYN